MYRSILKKDLKRKVTMNIILFLFVILATMFITSSVNNIMAVSNALEHFFEQAGMADYFVATSDLEGGKKLEDILQEMDCVQSAKVENLVYFSDSQVKINGKKQDMQGPVLTTFENRAIDFFDEKNQKITQLKKGEVLLPVKCMENNDIKKGDKVKITFGQTRVTLKVAGGIKDAMMGSALMSMERFLITQEDYDTLLASGCGDVQRGALAYIHTSDTKKLESEISKSEGNIIFNGSKSTISMTYIMDMVVAMALLLLSVCLILIAIIVLRFTIHYTLEEEFREIGVMKAIGIPNGTIRGLYLVKYFAMSLAGACVGLVAGIPFGNILLESTSKNIVMENTYGYGVNVLCAIFVVGVIVLYCYCCTGKLKKFSPIDAIRNGANGERYTKKGVISLSKSRICPSVFLAVNDIFSNIKRYVVMLLTFTIGLLAVLIVTNTINTLNSGNTLKMFGSTPGDVFILNDEDAYKYIMKKDGKEQTKKQLQKIQKKLEENGMSCKAGMEVEFKFSLDKEKKNCKSVTFLGVNKKTTDYEYLQGDAPRAADEVAITPLIAEKLDAEIGDTITITSAEGKHKVMVTGMFQTMSNLGEGVRLHEDFDLNFEQLMGTMGYGITFTDHPTQKEINQRVEKIKEFYPKSQVYNAKEYINHYMGGITETIEGVRVLFVGIAIIICLLVVILMERSFIAREKSEIALLKALGFENGTLVGWHTIRIAVVMFLAILLGEVFAIPVSQLTSGQVFKMMGAKTISFEIAPLEIFGIYPGALFVATVIGGFLVAQYMRSIPASEAATME